MYYLDSNAFIYPALCDGPKVSNAAALLVEIVAGMVYIGFAFAPAFGGRIPPATFAGYTFEGRFLVMALAMASLG